MSEGAIFFLTDSALQTYSTFILSACCTPTPHACVRARAWPRHVTDHPRLSTPTPSYFFFFFLTGCSCVDRVSAALPARLSPPSLHQSLPALNARTHRHTLMCTHARARVRAHAVKSLLALPALPSHASPPTLRSASCAKMSVVAPVPSERYQPTA